MRHALTLPLLLAACTENPFAGPPRETPEQVLARIEAAGPVDELAGTWRLRVAAAERTAWEGWSAAASPEDAARLKAAVDAVDAVRLVVHGTTMEVRRPEGTHTATFLVEATTLDEVGRSIVHLATTREDGTVDRLDVTVSGLEELTIARRGRDEPPTEWVQVREGAGGVP